MQNALVMCQSVWFDRNSMIGAYIMNDNPQIIADVEALAAKHGISLTADDYAAAHALEHQRQP